MISSNLPISIIETLELDAHPNNTTVTSGDNNGLEFLNLGVNFIPENVVLTNTPFNDPFKLTIVSSINQPLSLLKYKIIVYNNIFYIFGKNQACTYDGTTLTKLKYILWDLDVNGVDYVSDDTYLFLKDAYIYIFGGGSDSCGVVRYDIANDSYTTLSSIPMDSERKIMIMSVDKSTVYIYGKTGAYAYSISTDTYTAIATLNIDIDYRYSSCHDTYMYNPFAAGKCTYIIDAYNGYYYYMQIPDSYTTENASVARIADIPISGITKQPITFNSDNGKCIYFAISDKIYSYNVSTRNTNICETTITYTNSGVYGIIMVGGYVYYITDTTAGGANIITKYTIDEFVDVNNSVSNVLSQNKRMIAIGNDIYMFGGESATNAYKYNIVTRSYTQLALSPIAVGTAPLLYDGNPDTILLLDSAGSAVYVYRISTNTYSQYPSLTTAIPGPYLESRINPTTSYLFGVASSPYNVFKKSSSDGPYGITTKLTTAIPSSYSMKCETYYNNLIYIIYTSSSKFYMITFNPATETFGPPVLLSNMIDTEVTIMTCMGVYNGSLYLKCLKTLPRTMYIKINLVSYAVDVISYDENSVSSNAFITVNNCVYCFQKTSGSIYRYDMNMVHLLTHKNYQQNTVILLNVPYDKKTIPQINTFNGYINLKGKVPINLYVLSLVYIKTNDSFISITTLPKL